MTPEPRSPGHLASLACLIEVSARKPGNVHPGARFADTRIEDYHYSAAALVAPLDGARAIGVGAAVLEAVRATRRMVATNTNLGMILLLTPLAAVPEGEDLRAGVGRVLAATTVDDARLVYEAIRLARPGGLGNAPEQDVAGEPTVTLFEAMRLAAGRDLIARQYVNGYAAVFKVGLPALRDSLATRPALETAVVSAHMTLLARHPDTLIARKRGPAEAEEARRRASEVLAAGWPDQPASRSRFRDFDTWLRAEGHSRNPGATADLVAAVLYVALRDGTIRLPSPGGPADWHGDFQ